MDRTENRPVNPEERTPVNPYDAIFARVGARGGPPPPRTRARSLEEAKLMFRIAVQSAAVGPLSRLGRLNVRHLMAVAFGIGVTLGAFPAARRAVGALIARRLARQTDSCFRQ